MQALAKGKKAVYVICRRGIDSMTGTAKLIQADLELPPLLHVTGGMRAWTRTVDATLPEY